MESRIELLDEECLLSRAPNLEANKFCNVISARYAINYRRKGGIRFV